MWKQGNQLKRNIYRIALFCKTCILSRSLCIHSRVRSWIEHISQTVRDMATDFQTFLLWFPNSEGKRNLKSLKINVSTFITFRCKNSILSFYTFRFLLWCLFELIRSSFEKRQHIIVHVEFSFKNSLVEHIIPIYL